MSLTVSTGPGTPSPIPRTSARVAPAVGEQPVHEVFGGGQPVGRGRADVEGHGLFGDHVACEVADRDAQVGVAEVDSDGQPGAGREGHRAGPPSSVGRGRDDEQPAGGEFADDVGDGRAGEAGAAGDSAWEGAPASRTAWMTRRWLASGKAATSVSLASSSVPPNSITFKK